MPYETKEEILKLGEPDQEFMGLYNAHPPPPIDYSQVEPFVAMVEKRTAMLRESFGALPPTVKYSEITYPARDGTQLRALLYQPATPPANGSPLVVLFHGGGWISGDPLSEAPTCINLVNAFGATCMSASYRLAPKWKFPYAIDDAWDALQWAAANAASMGADPKVGFLVGGTSAGGNLAAVVAHQARDANLTPPLTGHYLAVPCICPPERWPASYKEWHLSFEQNKEMPVLPPPALEMSYRAYEPDFDDGKKFAIINHPQGHAGVSKCFLQLAGGDILRDDGLIYARALREESGIETKVEVYPGVPHGFFGFFPMLKSSKKFRAEQREGFGWLLGKTPDTGSVEKEAKPAVV